MTNMHAQAAWPGKPCGSVMGWWVGGVWGHVLRPPKRQITNRSLACSSRNRRPAAVVVALIGTGPRLPDVRPPSSSVSIECDPSLAQCDKLQPTVSIAILIWDHKMRDLTWITAPSTNHQSRKGYSTAASEEGFSSYARPSIYPPPGWSRIDGFKACNVGAEDFELGVAYMYYPACEEKQASPPAISTEAE
ncbi:uncharacterized protein K489DRAFT_367083 [Dissoconium aciculare CBS 342.82]|uniref:Uncharacterized protein n=1 Tax=Dissoconium aciculare CBS 342.82 TaxID=1314786 RepID=A0A6J3MDV5_9PEZI|nr:uncharacterized protein K489DRAFT_367083 [Dissoconium aciculare CBS 342.82]KAF1825789.1 hypothetical protein K489DRAFT_367083 [Dissoconium aciculare CBS 342.82]